MKPLIRIFEPERDYPIVESWWKAHGFPPVAPIVLPRLGVIAGREDADLAAAWLYMDNSTGVSMLEWMVTNPTNHPKDSLRGIVAVTEFLKAEALRMNYCVMLASCRQASLARVFEKNGFAKTDDGVTHLIALLKI